MSAAARPRPRAGVLRIAPYVPGGRSAGGGDIEPARLASNENALGASPAAIAAFQAAAGDMRYYPDPGAENLRAALAEAHGVDAGHIVCGAGSDELIALLTRAYAGPGDEVLFTRHAFIMYRLAALAADATPVAAPETDLTASVDALLAAATPRTRLAFLANPNNPTGTWIGADQVRRLRAGLRDDVLLVIDAAYAEFMDDADYEPGLDLARATIGGAGNVVMLRTFSKIHGLAGLRIGWAYCPPGVADALHRVRGPFNVNAAAQAAALAALGDAGHVARSAAHNRQWRPWLAERLRDLGLAVVSTAGNFALARFASADAAAATHGRLLARGLIVRPVAAYGLAACLRITVGTEAENRRLIDALAAGGVA